ncbi:MAG: type II toxin-antitoxin system RelE/ParE family toxin [Leptospiraceae bacterium]|nr:type II toxin-antitoxin system RelE/ParE family toxin [Leptospiraceae bacterium]
MGYNYKFTKKAEEDLEETYNYYEEAQEGLGSRFVINTFQKIETISAKPDSYSADSDGIRKTKVKGFKYYIYYIVKSPIFLIVAIWHTARRPFQKEERLKEN